MSFKTISDMIGKYGWITPADFNRIYLCEPSTEPRFPRSHAEFARYREEMRDLFEREGFRFDCGAAEEKGFDRLTIVNPLTGRSFSWSYHRQNRYGAMMQMHHQWHRFCSVGSLEW